MNLTAVPTDDETLNTTARNEGAREAPGSRDYSFAYCATIALTFIGFVGLYTGLSNLLNGHQLFAFVLAFSIQGLAVSSIHTYKRARRNGSTFNLLRGGQPLALYIVLITVIVTMSYSFWYRLQRASEAANETFFAHKRVMVSKLTQLESRYKSIGDGFADLAGAAAARAHEEREKGNTCRFPSPPSPKSPGPVERFRTRDGADFKDYAAQIASHVREITDRGNAVRARTLGQHMEIKATEATLNEIADQINTGLIGNPLLPGVVQFIDGRLVAGDNITYFGKTARCDDEQRTAQLITLKTAVKEIMAEKPLPPVKLLDPDSTYENTMLAANRIGALIESANPFSNTKLSDLDPGVRDIKLANGMKVYLPPDYWPLLIAAVIEVILFFVVPVPRPDNAKRDFLNALARGDEPLNWRTARQLLWFSASVPHGDSEIEEPSPAKPISLPGKFVRLRPYLHTHGNRYYLVIPHVLETALVHDYASAVALKGHAKAIVEESFTVSTLPSFLWRKRTLHLLMPYSNPTIAGAGAAVALTDQVNSPHDVPVRVLEVSREFFTWMISRIVDLDQDELVPVPQLQRKLAT